MPWWMRSPSRCTEVESGARNVDNILTNTLLPDISRQFLGRMAEGEKLESINVTIAENGAFAYTSGSKLGAPTSCELVRFSSEVRRKGVYGKPRPRTDVPGRKTC